MKIEDIRRLEYKPGDKFVLRVSGRVSQEVRQNIEAIMDDFAPGVPVLVLDDSISLSVLSAEGAA